MRNLYILLIFVIFSVHARAQTSPRIFALVVGECHYKDPALNRLRYSEDDATEFIRFLKSPEAGSIPDENIIKLTGQDATRSKILNDAYELFKQRAGENDMIIFYFSGHGIAVVGDGFLMPYEANDADPVGTGLPMEQLYGIINSSQAKMKTVYIDACHAGLYPHAAGTKGSAADRNAEITNAFSKIIAKSNGGVMSILSSRGNESSVESESYHSGLFTHFLLAGLKGAADKKPSDGRITAGELSDYLDEHVTDNTGYYQHPVITGTFDKDFPLSITDPRLSLTALIDKKRSVTATSGAVVIPEKPANEHLSKAQSFDGYIGYGTATFINRLSYPVILYAISGRSRPNDQDEYLPSGEQLTTIRLETKRQLTSVDQVADTFTDYTFFFRAEINGEIKYATVRKTLQGGLNMYFLLTDKNIRFTNKN